MNLLGADNLASTDSLRRVQSWLSSLRNNLPGTYTLYAAAQTLVALSESTNYRIVSQFNRTRLGGLH